MFFKTQTLERQRHTVNVLVVAIDLMMMMTMMTTSESRWKGNGLLLPRS